MIRSAVLNFDTVHACDRRTDRGNWRGIYALLSRIKTDESKSRVLIKNCCGVAETVDLQRCSMFDLLQNIIASKLLFLHCYFFWARSSKVHHYNHVA